MQIQFLPTNTKRETLPDENQNQLPKNHYEELDQLKDSINEHGGNINDTVIILHFLGYPTTTTTGF